MLSLVGLGISMFPYVVPPSITIWEAAAPTASLIFMLAGALIMVPDHPGLHRLFLLGVPRQDRVTRATTDAGSRGSGCGSSACGRPASASPALVGYAIKFWLK